MIVILTEDLEWVCLMNILAANTGAQWTKDGCMKAAGGNVDTQHS